jgi:phosphatidylserine/phosphatidylglycerophosphate/cardiolipin synthase-like enzyme
MVAAGAVLASCAFFRFPGPDARPGRLNLPWVERPALQRLLDQETQSLARSGNGVRLLVNGREAFPRRYENLATARWVLVKTFLWHNDDAGLRMASELARLQKSGVPVVVQFDAKGSLSQITDVQYLRLDRPSEQALIEFPPIRMMRDAGVKVIPTNRLTRGRLFLNAFRSRHPADPILVDAGPEPLPPLGALTAALLNAKARASARAEEQVGGVLEEDGSLYVTPQSALRRAVEAATAFNHGDHEKYFITGHGQGEIRAILGGTNIASEYELGGMPGARDSMDGDQGWRDTDVEVTGPAARDMVLDFLLDVERNTGEPLEGPLTSLLRASLLERSPEPAGRANVRLVVNHPHDDGERRVEDAYRILMGATPRGEPVVIATPYFAPTARLQGAILEHTRKGGHVTVLTNALSGTDVGILSEAARYCAYTLMKQTPLFHLYERTPDPINGLLVMHQKVASFGVGGPVIVGSTNLDAQSLIHNTESVVVVDDTDFRLRFDDMLATDLKDNHVRPVTMEQLEAQGIMEKIRGFLLVEVAWYWL